MFKKTIFVNNFKLKVSKKNIKKKYKLLIKDYDDGNQLLNSLSLNYKYKFFKKKINKFKKFKYFRLIGMGGSILGSEAIYQFLKFKIKKKFLFINNLNYKIKKNRFFTNIIISKSGNTLETISNINLLLKKNENNIFITENKNNFLNKLAQKLKSDIIEHNNFIGGRYSVLSEVGMVPAILMGLNEKKFKQFNSLIKNKYFFNSLIHSVASQIFLLKKKTNSIILNYDENSENLFRWYQQLIAESLGKKSRGILPFISNMPKDNHSLMQLYLEGPKNNFFTFFSVNEKNSKLLINKNLILNQNHLYKKSINQIIQTQKKATENVFLRKKIPFRSFTVNKRDEATLGSLFCFFILETILLGKALDVNPFDQPSVELIKLETKKILI